MKRIFSLMLVVLMLASVLPVAYAAKTCPACGGSNFRAYEHDCEVDMDCLDCGYCPGCSDYFWSDEDNDEVSTIVLYTGRAEEYYEVRVPAIMAPGTSRQVQIHGTWPSNRQLNVTVDPTVTMVNGLNPANTKTLNITMDNIALPGSDIDDDGPYYRDFNISVSNLSGVLFGTWTGEFNYNVEMVNIGPALISFTVNEPGYTKTDWEFFLM